MDDILHNLIQNYALDPSDFNAQKFAQAYLQSMGGANLPSNISKIESVATVSTLSLITAALKDGVKFQYLNLANINQNLDWVIEPELVFVQNADQEYGLLVEWLFHNSHCAEISSYEKDMAIIPTNSFFGTKFAIGEDYQMAWGSTDSTVDDLLQINDQYAEFVNWSNNYLKTLLNNGIEWVLLGGNEKIEWELPEN